MSKMEAKEIIKIVKRSGIGVVPTDTIYGLVGSALSKKAVGRIYKVRKRGKNKPFIVLIGSMDDLKKFDVKLNSRISDLLKKLWPGPASVILPVSEERKAKSEKWRGKSDKFRYLRRGTKTIAFRLPKDKWLRKFLQKTGPLVAPSANLAGERPARNIREARSYFGNRVDFYVDRGPRDGTPSSLIEIKR